MERQCVQCARPIILCNGFCKAGDILECMDGMREWKDVRELCFVCVEFFRWTEEGTLEFSLNSELTFLR